MSSCIAFDGSCLGGARPTGVERAFLRTLQALARMSPQRLVLFVPRDCHPSIRVGANGDCALPARVEVRRLPRLPLPLWRRMLLPRQLEEVEAAVLLSPTTALPPHAPCPMVATVHELPPKKRDDGEDSLLRALRQRRARLALVPRAVRVIVPSDKTRAALIAENPALADRVAVIAQPLGAAVLEEARTRLARAVKGAVGSTTPYGSGLVFLGAARRRKNLARIAEAYDQVPATLRAGHPFTWIGYEEHAPFAPRSAWRLLPPLDDSALCKELCAAKGLVLASCSEGFGLPALEALAFGVPPLVARASAPAEYCAQLAVTSDPYDVASITEGLQRLLEDEAVAERASRLGPSLASAFTPEATAAAWLALFDEVRTRQAP